MKGHTVPLDQLQAPVTPAKPVCHCGMRPLKT